MKNRHLALIIAVAALVNLTAQLYRWPSLAVIAVTVAAGIGTFATIDSRRHHRR